MLGKKHAQTMAYCCYNNDIIMYNDTCTCTNVPSLLQQGQKLFKKESDVGMLLTGKQSIETSCT